MGTRIKQGSLEIEISENFAGRVTIVEEDGTTKVEVTGPPRELPVDTDLADKKHDQRVLAFFFGAAFLVVLVIIAIFIGDPTGFQIFVFRVVLAIAAAGAAAMIPGFLSVKIATWVRASGALAVFALVFLVNPPALVAEEGAGTGAQQPPKIVQDILSEANRRAFSLNFGTRFAERDDFDAVLKSISDMRIFVQRHMGDVRAQAPEHLEIVQKMLGQLERMETTFKRMEPYARGYSPEEGPPRLDGTGPVELTTAFQAMETVRQDFLATVRELADRVAFAIPPPPVS